MAKWKETELAYLAGLIDGEGSISIFLAYSSTNGKKYPRYYMSLSIYNSHRGCLDWVKKRFGGRVYQTKRHRPNDKDNFSWQTGFQHGRTVLKRVYPYMIIKKRQAELYIECSATTKKYGKPGVPCKILNRRKEIAAEMKILNMKGLGNALAA